MGHGPFGDERPFHRDHVLDIPHIIYLCSSSSKIIVYEVATKHYGWRSQHEELAGLKGRSARKVERHCNRHCLSCVRYLECKDFNLFVVVCKAVTFVPLGSRIGHVDYVNRRLC